MKLNRVDEWNFLSCHLIELNPMPLHLFDESKEIPGNTIVFIKFKERGQLKKTS